MEHIDINHVFDNISDEQMEVLLRRWLKAQLQRLDEREFNVTFDVDIARGTDPSDIVSCEWKVGSVYSEGETKGEVLREVIAEQNRRRNFRKTCRLRSIEDATTSTPPPLIPAPVSVDDDEIPF